MIIEDSFLVNLHSSDGIKRNGTFNSNILFTTKGVLKPDINILYNEISLFSAQIPNSFYIINEYNNTLNFLIGITYSTVSIPYGNYTYIDFRNKLLELLPSGFTISLNNKTGILTFSYSQDFTFLSSSTIRFVLGFRENSVSTTNSLSLAYPLNLLGSNAIKISSNLGNSNIDTQNGNLLCVFSTNVQAFGLITYYNQNNFRNILRQDKIDEIQILITDENNNLIDFNNLEWQIQIKISTFRQVQINAINNSTDFLSNATV